MKVFSGYNRIIIPYESESTLNAIGFCNRNVSSVEFDKLSCEFSIKKTWPFFSDKIKILYEKGTDVFFLNSEKMLCVTNSRNQAMLRVLSSDTFNQAIIFAESQSSSLFLLVECKKYMKILELSNIEVLNVWSIDSHPISSDICVRGKFFIVKTIDQTLVLQFNGASKLPFDMCTIKSEHDDIDILNREQDGHIDQLNLIGYKLSESGIKISSFYSTDYLIRNVILFNDPTLSKSKLEFGKCLCISGNIICL